MNLDSVIPIGDGNGPSLNPLVPHVEHNYAPTDWPAATLTEVRPKYRNPLAPGAACWLLSEPYLGASVVVLGVEAGRPDFLYGWESDEHGVIKETNVHGEVFLPGLIGVWSAGTPHDTALARIGYRAVR